MKITDRRLNDCLPSCRPISHDKELSALVILTEHANTFEGKLFMLPLQCCFCLNFKDREIWTKLRRKNAFLDPKIGFHSEVDNRKISEGDKFQEI